MSASEYMTLKEAATVIPGNPHTSAIWRWCRQGILSKSGERIKLHHIRVGGRIMVSLDALETFYREVADSDRDYFDSDDSSEVKNNPFANLTS